MTDKKAPKSVTPKKAAVDWDLVEKHYRAGLMTLRQIGDACGVSHVAIGKRAKTYGWSRDLTKKIEQKAKELVTKQMVTKQGYQEEKSGNESKLSDAQVVDAYAQKVADVDLFNRADVLQSMDITRGMWKELGALSNPEFFEDLEKLGELLDQSGPNASGTWIKDKLNETYRYIISLAGRIKMAKEAAGTHAIYIPLQRKMFGLDVEKEQTTDLDQLLQKIATEKANA